jgi:cobyrinic acid a,c-diamide synthase
MVNRLPRVVIAAPGSGQGKTTVATRPMAALRGRRRPTATKAATLQPAADRAT